MARRDSQCQRKQVHRARKNSNHRSSPPQPAQRLPQHARCHGNSTVLSMLQTIEGQSSANGALHDELRREKANSALLPGVGTLLYQSKKEADTYRQSLDAVGAELRNTNETLEYATDYLQATEEELQQADVCIQAQAELLHEKACTISSLQAENESLSQQNQELERHNQFLKKQLACEHRDNKGLMVKLQECEGKLAAAVTKRDKLAHHNTELKAEVAGNYTALVSTALSGGAGLSVLLWFCVVLVFSAIESCVLLQIVLLTTIFTSAVEGFIAAPKLLQEGRVYAVVSWGLLCDLLSHVGAGTSGCWLQSYASCADLFKCLRAAVAGRCARIYVGCVGLLHNAKAVVCCYRSSMSKLSASSSEVLLPCWGSTRRSSADITPASSNRSSVGMDAVDDTVHGDVGAEVFVVVSLKKGPISAKVTDV